EGATASRRRPHARAKLPAVSVARVRAVMVGVAAGPIGVPLGTLRVAPGMTRVSGRGVVAIVLRVAPRLVGAEPVRVGMLGCLPGVAVIAVRMTRGVRLVTVAPVPWRPDGDAEAEAAVTSRTPRVMRTAITA